ncbi:MAG: hypothetical protein P1V81_15150, partial [Planctomycetota bacterium]|nr:hypothetical protein [Planctomycetota bacterium]
VDLATAQLLGMGSAPGFSASFGIPGLAALAGIELNLQAAVLLAGPVPETSNGLRLVLGG